MNAAGGLMRAAVAGRMGSRITVEQIRVSEVRPDEVLVRMVSCGVCHTDTAVLRGHIPTTFPIILGHEGAGIVQHVGENVSEFKVGDSVLMSYDHCGDCISCSRNKPNYCIHHRAYNFSGLRHPQGATYLTHDETNEPVHGSFFGQSSFAEYSVGCARNMVKVEASRLPLHLLAPLGCGVQTGAGAVVNTLKAETGTSLAVFGCGSVGLSSIMAAKRAGCSTIHAIDKLDSRIELASELGATHCHRAEELGGGITFDNAVETTGIPEVLQAAFQRLIPGGDVVLLGGSAPGSAFTAEMLSILLGRGVRGAIQGDSLPKVFLPQLIQWNNEGTFPFEKMITEYDGLDLLNQAMEDAELGHVVKPLINIAPYQ